MALSFSAAENLLFFHSTDRGGKGHSCGLKTGRAKGMWRTYVQMDRNRHTFFLPPPPVFFVALLFSFDRIGPPPPPSPYYFTYHLLLLLHSDRAVISKT